MGGVIRIVEPFRQLDRAANAVVDPIAAIS
jgi:hypothetical protein